MYIYGYENLKRDADLLSRNQLFETFSIGKSVLGKELICFKLGEGPNKVFYNGAHHALEWITSALLVKFLKEISDAYLNGEEYYGYDTGHIFERSSLYVVPMVNPDGVELVKNGAEGSMRRSQLIQWNHGSDNFSTTWQANIRGVDLNHNYSAGWSIAKEMEDGYGIHGPGPTRFGGEEPESEPETRAMVHFSREQQFNLSLCYHTQGEEIYYQYMKYTPKKSAELAQMFAKASGYRLARPAGIASHGGYKDWFLKTFMKPSFTIEAGVGTNPLPIEQLDDIYQKNKQLLALAAVHS